jgi:3-oxoadipate enol-lactonase
MTQPGATPWTSRPVALPRGQYIQLDGRGRTFVRDAAPLTAEAAARPAVLLLHGWMATGALNWYPVFEPLQSRYRVLAPDLRGHGRGLRTRRIFRLADCADDAAETIEALGAGPVIAVGYSMGGPVAQLFWQRHRDLCAGLVLAATSAGFVPGTRERIVFASTMAAAIGTTRLGQAATRVPLFQDRISSALSRSVGAGALPHWAAREFRRHDWRMVMEAGHSIATYHARWIGDVDVPTAVVVTTDDRAVAPHLQRKMAAEVPGAVVHEAADGHLACARPGFPATLLRAIDDVESRL